MVDDRNIQQRKDRHEAKHDTPEQELVLPHINHPLREIALTLWLHAEETASEVHQLPRQEEREPHHAHERGGAGAEYLVALRAIGVVAVGAETAVAEAVDDQAEAGETEG